VNRSIGERLLVATGITYLLALTWCISNVSYDVWGILVVLPPLAILGILGIKRTFAGEYQPLQRVMLFGLAAKLAGVLARYWVSFDAYGGATDAARYHAAGALAAGRVWSGQDSPLAVIPFGTGTEFIIRFTGMVYTLVGSSQLAGFVVFAFMSYWGVVLFVKAACLAIPGLLQRRYALLCAFTPSVVYWPSSIGKEAPMMLSLGIASYGFARLLSRHGVLVPTIISVAGIAGTMFIRPHIGGLWVAGLLPALVVMTIKGHVRIDDARRGRGANRIVLLAVIAVAAAGLSFVASTTMRYLQFNEGTATLSSDNLTNILAETTRRTTEAGSNFQPVVVTGPTDWPEASLRTLTRPLIIEARNLFQLITALEMTALIGLMLYAYRRLLNLPRLMFTNPYITFAMVTLFLGGLAYSSFANLGVLARQKSLILPLMLLIPCIPALPSRFSRSPRPLDELRAETAGPEPQGRPVEIARR
jgi:hypothetical protein